MQLIEFVGEVVSQEACGAHFTTITRAILDGAGQFLTADEKAASYADTQTMEQYQLEVNKIWWEKCGLLVGGTFCTIGAVISAICAPIDPAALAGTGSLLTLAIPMFTKVAALQSPDMPKQHTSENVGLLEAIASFTDETSKLIGKDSFDEGGE